MKRNKKFIIKIVVAICCSMLFSSCGCSKENRDSSDTPSYVETEENTSENVPQETNQETEAEGNTDGGGNENNAATGKQKVEISILVDEDTYIYENAPVTLKDIINEVEGLDEEVTVVITEHNATKNAFEELTDAFEENEINYVSE